MPPSTLVLGIHIGSTACSVAVYRQGNAEVCANEQGSRMTPACIAFTEVETLLGEPARAQLVRNASNTVTDGMHLLGRVFDDEAFQSEVAAWKFCVSKAKDGGAQVEVNVKGEAKVFTPARLLSLLLARLRADAAAATGEEVKEAIVAHPAYFDEAQRAALRDAAQIGAIKVKMLLSAPLCVALLHGHGEGGEGDEASGRPRQFLVVDVGGATCEASVVERAAAPANADADADGGECRSVNEYGVRATVCERGLCGASVDVKLRAHVLKEIKRRQRVDLSDNARAMSRLLSSCEAAKIALSAAPQATINVEADGCDYSSTVSRAALEELTGPVAANAAALASRALAAAGISAGCIDAVLLAGGGCRMPKVRAALAALCPDAALVFGAASEESVCRGAALSGAMLRPLARQSATARDSESTNSLVPRARLPRALGLLASDGSVLVRLAEARAAVPLTRCARFAPPAAGTPAALLVTLAEVPNMVTAEGASPLAADCGDGAAAARPVAKLAVRGAVPEGTSALVVTLVVDESASLTIRCEAELGGQTEGDAANADGAAGVAATDGAGACEVMPRVELAHVVVPAAKAA